MSSDDLVEIVFHGRGGQGPRQGRGAAPPPGESAPGGTGAGTGSGASHDGTYPGSPRAGPPGRIRTVRGGDEDPHRRIGRGLLGESLPGPEGGEEGQEEKECRMVQGASSQVSHQSDLYITGR